MPMPLRKLREVIAAATLTKTEIPVVAQEEQVGVQKLAEGFKAVVTMRQQTMQHSMEHPSLLTRKRPKRRSLKQNLLGIQEPLTESA